MDDDDDASASSHHSAKKKRRGSAEKKKEKVKRESSNESLDLTEAENKQQEGAEDSMEKKLLEKFAKASK